MAPLDAAASRHAVFSSPLVRAAYAAAAGAHAGQVRKSGAPVISHCLATAEILAELGLPEEAVAAGLLHDVLSDTRVTAWQLEEHVPRSCVELVRRVLRDGGQRAAFGATARRCLDQGARPQALAALACFAACFAGAPSASPAARLGRRRPPRCTPNPRRPRRSRR
jgi:hypothetical protein